MVRCLLMYSIILGAGLNILLNPVFILTFEMGMDLIDKNGDINLRMIEIWSRKYTEEIKF